jgi:hypothetical protein
VGEDIGDDIEEIVEKFDEEILLEGR